MSYLKQSFIEYLYNKGNGQPGGYCNGLDNVEKLFNVDIDSEFEKDQCKSLYELIQKIRKNPEKIGKNEHTVRQYASNVKKYTEFRLEQKNNEAMFSWVPFYEEFATKLLAYKNNRQELLEKVRQCFESLSLAYPFKERGQDSYDDVDPFTVFGTFNKRMTDENRIRIIAAFKDSFDVNADVPKDFSGIPVLMNLSAWFFAYKANRAEKDIDNLWALFESALVYADGDLSKEREFIANYNQVITQKQIKWNITIGLYWVRPKAFLSLDSVSRAYLPKFNPPVGEAVASDSLPVGEKYLENIRLLRNSFSHAATMAKSFYELSQMAFEYAASSQNNIERIIEKYKSDFERVNKEERYKWEAIYTYKKYWDIDAPDFAAMIESALQGTYNLLQSGNYLARTSLLEFAKEEPETVRGLFKLLHNENLDFESRYYQFREAFKKHFDLKNKSHYQDLHAVSVYLSFEFPEKYYIYKYGIYKGFAELIQHEDAKKIDSFSDVVKYEKYCALCEAILDEIYYDDQLQNLSRKRLTEKCYLDENYHMLAVDIAYFGSRQTHGWWPSQEEYRLELTKEDWKKYITQVEMPDHSCPMQMLKAMMQLGGEASCKRLAKEFGGSVSYYVGCAVNLGRRVKEYFNLPPCIDGDKERYFPFPFFGKGFELEDGHQYVYKIRPEFYDALKEIDLSRISTKYKEEEAVNDSVQKTDVNKNTILYGPPGTGKTYNTVVYAVAIIENKLLDDVKKEPYAGVLARYNQYKADGLIEFTTFHQSYGYEEFIEGIRPVIDNADEDQSDIQYQISAGLFKSFCEKAGQPVLKQEKTDIGLNNSPTVWKVSLEGTGENQTRRECMENGHIRIGYDEYGKDVTGETVYSFGGKNVINAFVSKMKIGDIVLSCYSSTTIDAIGVVTGDYEWHNEYEHYKRLRKVNWIVKGINEDITAINSGSTLTLSSVYKLNIALADVMTIIAKKSPATTVEEKKKNYVFIIDEINRGNISKIFGELITLIETSKRIGQPEGMKAKLPYSQQLFGVPDNVYIIGTMNTADRSIATIDTALRRRFRFKEMMPDVEVLKDINVADISVSEMLVRINKRISVLYDREHTIGHAYFIPLKDNPTIEQLSDIFENAIIPLLQEYFYEDYEKIRLVLGDNKKAKKETQFITISENNYNELFGDADIGFDDTVTYEINRAAFNNIEAYRSI